MADPKEDKTHETAPATNNRELSQQEMERISGGNTLNPQPLPPVHDPHPGGGDDLIK